MLSWAAEKRKADICVVCVGGNEGMGITMWRSES